MRRLAFCSRATLGALALALFGACGAEDVNFWADLGDAAPSTGSDATTASDAPATPDGVSLSGPTDAHPPPFPKRDAALACCMADGNNCESPADCCSGRCDQNSCVPFFACGEPGTLCTSRNDCCSGRCEPNQEGPGPSVFTCLPYCATRGASCQRASDCCSLGCNKGHCGGPICSEVGTYCQTNSDCCSGDCTAGRCQIAGGSCLPTGEACVVVDDAGDFCCSGVCNQMSGRCDQGNSGMCRAAWSPCIVPAIPFQEGSNCQCCSGNCMYNAEETVAVCVPPDGPVDF